MARKRDPLRPHDKTVEEEMMEDMGVPGKLYFDKPVLTLVTSFRDKLIDADGNDLNATEGPVRMKSVQEMYKPKGEVQYDLGQRPSQEEMAFYLAKWRVNGYGEGAVVSRRWTAPWRVRSVSEWGVIRREKNFKDYQEQVPWAPYMVQWFDAKEGNYESNWEKCWAEDMICIQTCMDKGLLEDIIEAQDGLSQPGTQYGRRSPI